MPKLQLTMVLCAGTAVLAMACGDDAGCVALGKKLGACSDGDGVAVYSRCDDGTKAACIAEKLDATCSNLATATAECQ